MSPFQAADSKDGREILCRLFAFQKQKTYITAGSECSTLLKRFIMDQIEDDDYSGKKVTKEPSLCHLAILVDW